LEGQKASIAIIESNTWKNPENYSGNSKRPFEVSVVTNHRFQSLYIQRPNKSLKKRILKERNRA
jgi:hypothetical protein